MTASNVRSKIEHLLIPLPVLSSGLTNPLLVMSNEAEVKKN